MQSRNYLLSLITLIIAFLLLNPFGLTIQDAFVDQVTIRPDLFTTTDPSLDHARYLYEGPAAGETGNADTMVSQQVQVLIPTSEQLVDGAIAVLSKGWRGMSPQEKEAFLNLYDPGAAGEVDQAFVRSVLDNYEQIRRAMEKDIHVSYEPDHNLCEGERLYFTDLVSLHVCPYFYTETNEMRKARTLIHEYAHIALRVKDRPYYRPTSKAFAELTPKGPWATQLPVIGPIVREIVASDTLYHPDTYAHFARAMSGQPGVLDKYLDQGTVVTIVRIDDDAYGHGSNYQVTDSWLGS